jgi:HPt (histidine-containing phosphotransfer) domain-containing protein
VARSRESAGGVSFEDVFAELKKQYLAELPAKVQRIENYLRAGQWIDVHNEFHKLKGTGKTYGFPAISRACQIIETLTMGGQACNPDYVHKGLAILQKIHRAETAKSAFDLDSDIDYMFLSKCA